MTRPERIHLVDLLDGSGGEVRMKTLAASLLSGAVIIYPTETIYGIGGCAGMAGVRDRIVAAKGRAPDNPMLLIAPERRHFDSLPIIMPRAAKRLAAAFWPGLITLVVPCTGMLAQEYPDGVGIRVSPHPFLVSLFRFLDRPLYSTSANLSGEPYAGDPDRIFSIFDGAVDRFVDAGILPQSPPSTVVRVDSSDSVTVLREGAVSRQAVERAC